ncbi:MAG: hypothetical protein KGQ60_09525, partial [Planctomycetes bacterium]|nr:hypothetical protein [Planctomycetota bacterium]
GHAPEAHDPNCSMANRGLHRWKRSLICEVLESSRKLANGSRWNPGQFARLALKQFFGLRRLPRLTSRSRTDRDRKTSDFWIESEKEVSSFLEDLSVGTVNRYPWYTSGGGLHALGFEKDCRPIKKRTSDSVKLATMR